MACVAIFNAWAGSVWPCSNAVQWGRVPVFVVVPLKSLWMELRAMARRLGFSPGTLTPYGIRRGVATWHFLRFGSLSITAALGRWESERTARIYAEGAAAELAAWTFAGSAGSLVSKAAQVASRVLRGEQRNV